MKKAFEEKLWSHTIPETHTLLYNKVLPVISTDILRLVIMHIILKEHFHTALRANTRLLWADHSKVVKHHQLSKSIKCLNGTQRAALLHTLTFMDVRMYTIAKWQAWRHFMMFVGWDHNGTTAKGIFISSKGLMLWESSTLYMGTSLVVKYK